MYPFLKPGDRIIVNRVSPKSFQVGDIALARIAKDNLVAHRLVKILPLGKGVLKGDSLLSPDPEPVELSKISGRVDAILRGKQFIPVSTGIRSRMKGLYVILSLKGLTIGALRLKAKLILMRLFPLDGSNGSSKERMFIISVLGGHAHNGARNLDRIKVKEIASEEGVAGILYWHFKESGMQRSTLSPLKDYYLSIATQNLINLNALERLEDALDSVKMEVMTLKGVSLLDYVYPGIGMRPMGDLDLMVRPEDRKEFINLLERLGYRRDPLLSHLLRKDRVVIDLHIHALNVDRITSRAELFPSGMGPVWEMSVPWKEGFRWLRRPDDMDNVLLLSQHLMKHSFSRLIWLSDIFRILENHDDIFWIKLSKRVDYLLQKRPLAYTLYLLNRLFDFEPPEGLGFKDISKDLSRIERGILGARIRGQSIDRMGPFLALFSIHGFMARIAFAWETIFPKKSVVEREFIRSFGSKIIVFYPFRLFQTLALASRHLSIILSALVRGT